MRSAFFPHSAQKYHTQFHLIDQSNHIANRNPSPFIISLIIIMKFQSYRIALIRERERTSARAAGGSPAVASGTVSKQNANANAKYADAHFSVPSNIKHSRLITILS
jgi:hypothetical protein